jgi:protein TonB
MKSSARPEGARAAVARQGTALAVEQQVERPTYEPDGQRRRTLAVFVLAIHLLLVWGFLQLDQVRRAVVAVAPIVVRLLPAPTQPTPPAPTAALKAPDLPQRSVPQVPPPLFEITQPPTAPTITVAVMTPTVVPEAVVAAPRASSALMVAQLVPVAPVLKRIAPGSVRYRIEPRLTMPLLSKRLHESGIVYLLVRVDSRGLLAATVQKSSGFARLDAQALQDIRSARFVPQTENGQPIDWETVAPMSYELN